MNLIAVAGQPRAFSGRPVKQIDIAVVYVGGEADWVDLGSAQRRTEQTPNNLFLLMLAI